MKAEGDTIQFTTVSLRQSLQTPGDEVFCPGGRKEFHWD